MLIFNITQQIQTLTSASQSFSNDKDASKIIREILQNSYDSANEVDNFEKARIKFLVEFVDKSEIPSIDEYEEAITKIEREKINTNSQEIDIFNTIKNELKNDKIPVLFVIDNGVGFDREKLESVLGDGTSNKNNSNSGGSYGNGHFAPYGASNLRYCMYGGKIGDGSRFCSGQAILRTFHDENDYLRSANGFLVTKEGISIEAKNDIFYKDGEIPNLINKKLDLIGQSGGVLCIIGFNFFDENDENLDDIIKMVTAKNFFGAVYDNLLEIEIVNFDGKISKISKSNLDDIFVSLGEKYDKKIEPKSAKLFYETLKSGRKYTLEMNEMGGGIHRYIHKSKCR